MAMKIKRVEFSEIEQKVYFVYGTGYNVWEFTLIVTPNNVSIVAGDEIVCVPALVPYIDVNSIDIIAFQAWFNDLLTENNALIVHIKKHGKLENE